jgi:hypothetical protein
MVPGIHNQKGPQIITADQLAAQAKQHPELYADLMAHGLELYGSASASNGFFAQWGLNIKRRQAVRLTGD